MADKFNIISKVPCPNIQNGDMNVKDSQNFWEDFHNKLQITTQFPGPAFL